METNRRNFIKLVGAIAAASVVPISLATTIELEAVIDEPLLKKAITVGPSPDRNGFLATFDMDQIWQAVHLVDQYGHEWRTSDQGETWSWNGHSFSTEWGWRDPMTLEAECTFAS